MIRPENMNPMPDAALLTHPRNRRHVDAMRAASPALCQSYGLSSIDIGYDKTLAQRRVLPDGRDDGPLFVLFMEVGHVTLKLVKS